MSASIQSFPALDLEAVERKQQITRSSGDFSVVATRMQIAAELLPEAADSRAGSRVLDVATGSGNPAGKSIAIPATYLQTIIERK